MPAKRHHYVPRFLLRRFSSDPLAENPLVWWLDTRSGRLYKSTVESVAVIRHYYRLEELGNFSRTLVEDALAVVEGWAAKAVRKLAEGEGLNPRDRVNMATFLQVQQHRTPVGRASRAPLMVRMALDETEAKLQDPKFAGQVHEILGESKTPEELEEWRLTFLAQLQSGQLTLDPGQDAEVSGIFIDADRMAPIIAERMTWVSLRAPHGSAFICSDHPVRFQGDDGRVALVGDWTTSGTKVTVPIDQRICLRLMPGPPGWELRTVDAATVEEINLGTYASAQGAIYGPTQQVVQGVRANVKRNPTLLAGLRPRPLKLVIPNRSAAGQPTSARL